MATVISSQRSVNPNKIDIFKENPRGETEVQIVTGSQFKQLMHSIKDFGVIEPLIVKKNVRAGKEFVLVDGERRLRAAILVNLKKVPILIAKDEADALHKTISIFENIYGDIFSNKYIK